MCRHESHINECVLALIRYRLGDSPNCAEMLSICTLNGVLLYAQCTEIRIAITESIGKFSWDVDNWASSEQQSDQLLIRKTHHTLRGATWIDLRIKA